VQREWNSNPKRYWCAFRSIACKSFLFPRNMSTVRIQALLRRNVSRYDLSTTRRLGTCRRCIGLRIRRDIDLFAFIDTLRSCETVGTAIQAVDNDTRSSARCGVRCRGCARTHCRRGKRGVLRRKRGRVLPRLSSDMPLIVLVFRVAMIWAISVRCVAVTRGYRARSLCWNVHPGVARGTRKCFDG
jgi:hypothetical protein